MRGWLQRVTAKCSRRRERRWNVTSLKPRLEGGGTVLVQKSSRLCENVDAKSVDPIFAEIWPVLSDQNPANRENSL
jgi:hypothetical protein